MGYPFLLLSLLLLIPSIIIFSLRQDLRRPQILVALLALPFALTEFFFYPDYWAPAFLWNLVERIGFGLEDLLFVFGLGAFVSTAYPAFFRKQLVPYRGSANKRLLKIAVPIGLAIILAAISYLIQLPVIWSCVPIMISIAIGMCANRPDLRRPAIFGALNVTAVYFAVCLALEALLPNVFALNWNASRFSNLFVLHIPLEELSYAFAAGLVGTVFYPFAFSMQYTNINATNDPDTHI